MSGYRTFVVPYDFSEHSLAALYAAADLAKRLGAELHLVHALQAPAYVYGLVGYGGAAPPLPPPPPIDLAELREGAMKSLREAAARVGDLPGKVEPHVIEGAAIADVICALAEELGADLIVMGTHGRTGLSHVFLGSVAERTLRKAPCPVLTVKAPKEREES